MRLNLTDKAVASLRFDHGQQTAWDTQLRGFGIRIGRHRKTWTVLVGEQRKRITIGHYPQMSLKEARAAARTLLYGRQDPGEPSITVAQAIDQYCELHLALNTKPSSGRETERLLRRHFVAALGTTNLRAVGPRDITGITNSLKNTPTEANSAFAAARAFFNWVASQHLIPHSPLLHTRAPFKTRSRQRVLSDPELTAVLQATTNAGAYNHIIRLLIYTGQRRSEIACLRWDYIDQQNRLITLPKELVKNNTEHIFPYGQHTADLLANLARDNDFLFAFPFPNKPFDSWSRSKAELDKVCGIAPGFTHHDLRRTFATTMGRLRVAPHVIEHLLNHKQPKIAAIYNRWQYIDEQREALRTYDQFLTTHLSRASQSTTVAA